MHAAAQEPAKTPAKKAKAKAKAAPEGEEGAEGEDAAKATPAKKKRQDPAEAQRAIEAAVKLLEAGKAEPAVQALSAVISGGNLPPAIMAKALFYRGVAYRQQKLHTQAIADLTSALWLKGGLGGNDRADALRQRTSAYQEAGLAEGGEAVAPAAIPGASRAPTRTASTEQGWGSEASPIRAGNAEAIGRLESVRRLVRRLIVAASQPVRAACEPRRAHHRLHRSVVRARYGPIRAPAPHKRLVSQHRGA